MKKILYRYCRSLFCLAIILTQTSLTLQGTFAGAGENNVEEIKENLIDQLPPEILLHILDSGLSFQDLELGLSDQDFCSISSSSKFLNRIATDYVKWRKCADEVGVTPFELAKASRQSDKNLTNYKRCIEDKIERVRLGKIISEPNLNYCQIMKSLEKKKKEGSQTAEIILDKAPLFTSFHSSTNALNSVDHSTFKLFYHSNQEKVQEEAILKKIIDFKKRNALAAFDLATRYAENECFEEAVAYVIDAELRFYSLDIMRHQNILYCKEMERLAKLGSEAAVQYLINSYWYGYAGLRVDEEYALEIAREYAQKGSLIAMAKIITESPRPLPPIEELEEED